MTENVADPPGAANTPVGWVTICGALEKLPSRTRSLSVSSTYRLPLPSTAMPDGPLKSALAPVPSVLPARDGVPASVVTTPAGVISRMVLPFSSQTKRLPFASIVIPSGTLNRAAVPVPSVLPELPPLPAMVVTTPPGVIFRMMSFA